MLPRSRRTQIEVAIVEILEDYGLTEYPMSVGKLATALGIDLVPHPLVIAMGSGTTVANIAERFGVSHPCASVALGQARARRNEGSPWRTHEQWLIYNATWRGGGLLASA